MFQNRSAPCRQQGTVLCPVTSSHPENCVCRRSSWCANRRGRSKHFSANYKPQTLHCGSVNWLSPHTSLTHLNRKWTFSFLEMWFHALPISSGPSLHWSLGLWHRQSLLSSCSTVVRPVHTASTLCQLQSVNPVHAQSGASPQSTGVETSGGRSLGPTPVCLLMHWLIPQAAVMCGRDHGWTFCGLVFVEEEPMDPHCKQDLHQHVRTTLASAGTSEEGAARHVHLTQEKSARSSQPTGSMVSSSWF